MSDIIVFDLDGTIANIDHRRHLVEGKNKDWQAFYEACVKDSLNVRVAKVLEALKSYNYIELWSGRCESVKGHTGRWLHNNGIGWLFSNIRMRPLGDYTPDDQLKEKWLKEEEDQGNFVTIAFDDRKKVVDMWRRNGVQCFQVADGDF